MSLLCLMGEWLINERVFATPLFVQDFFNQVLERRLMVHDH